MIWTQQGKGPKKEAIFSSLFTLMRSDSEVVVLFRLQLFFSFCVEYSCFRIVEFSVVLVLLIGHFIRNTQRLYFHVFIGVHVS